MPAWINRVKNYRHNCLETGFRITFLIIAVYTVFHLYSLQKSLTKGEVKMHTERLNWGREYNDPYTARSSLMDPARQFITDPKGIYLFTYPIDHDDIGSFSSIGYLTYHFYPVPVWVFQPEQIHDCDYIISNRSMVDRLQFLKQHGEVKNFKVLNPMSQEQKSGKVPIYGNYYYILKRVAPQE